MAEQEWDSALSSPVSGLVLVPDWPAAAEPVADWLRQLHELRWSAALPQPGAAPAPAGAITAAVQVAEPPAGKRSKDQRPKEEMTSESCRRQQ